MKIIFVAFVFIALGCSSKPKVMKNCFGTELEELFICEDV